jgi:hypothetical protein
MFLLLYGSTLRSALSRFVHFVSEPAANRPCLTRSLVDVPVSDNFDALFTSLGFELDYEYVEKGFLFKDKDIDIRVYQMYKVSSLSPVCSQCVRKLNSRVFAFCLR